MDCHDGETEPEVYHKLTLTSRVTVREICKAINKYAFVTSPYPIILSAEIHCNTTQQIHMAKTMREIFGDKLITQPIDDRTSASLPSPEELKYRVMFKAKPKTSSPPSLSINSPSPTRDGGFFDTTTPVPPNSAGIASSDTESDSTSKLTKLVRRISFGGGGSSNDSTTSSSSAASGQSPSLPPKKTFSDELKDLLVYTAGVKYAGFSKLNNYLPNQQFSLSDRTAERILKENKPDWIKHNITHLTRIYPKGSRLNSGNYDPRPVWSAGCQLVAINCQTVDQGTILNHALFIDTGGYVLKPLALRLKVLEYPISIIVKIEIISAQRLPLSASDLYVEGQIDEVEMETKVIKGTSMAPSWNHKMEWTIKTLPSLLELTFVKLEIRAKGKGRVAQWVRPINALPKGYHYLPLYDDMFSKYVFATLFVKIQVEVVELEVKKGKV